MILFQAQTLNVSGLCVLRLSLIVQWCNGDSGNRTKNVFLKCSCNLIFETYRSKNCRFDCILNKRSYSWRWWRFILNVLDSVIKIKSKPKLKPVQRHFWNPCSWSIRPHRKHVSKKTLLSLSCGLEKFDF